MFKFRIMPDGGDPYEVVATTRDIAKWERTTRGASLAKLQSDMHATDLYGVAFHAAARQGHYTGTLAVFEADHDLDVLDLDEDEEPDPTRSAA